MRMQQHMRLASNHMRTPAFSAHRVEHNRPAQLTGILGQRQRNARLSIQFALPHTNPGSIAIRLGYAHSAKQNSRNP